MLLQLEWQYLQRTVPGVGTIMGPIEEALREKSLPSLFGGEEIDADFRKILGHGVKNGVQDTRYPSTARGSSLAVNDCTLDVRVTSDRPSTP